MTNFTFSEAQECRVLLGAKMLTREEAKAMHVERCRLLESEGWKRCSRSVGNIQPYLGREGEEVRYALGKKSRLIRWEADYTSL
jgi:hypothetical protein